MGLASKQRNAIHGYQPVPQDMKDGWVVDDDELLFWVPLEHREDLYLPHLEMLTSPGSGMAASGLNALIKDGWRNLRKAEREWRDCSSSRAAVYYHNFYPAFIPSIVSITVNEPCRLQYTVYIPASIIEIEGS